MMRRPIRARVTIAFTAAMAVILAAFGTFLYLRTQSELDESVNDTLELRAGDTESFFTTTDKGGYELLFDSIDPEDSFSQVVSASGQVRFSTSQLSDSALTPQELAQAHEGSITIERDSLDPLDGRVRILARPVEGSDPPAVSIVGVSLEDRDGSLKTLAVMLLLGLPAALLLSGAAGYWAAGRALGPVETMRKEAAVIGGASGERLAVPTPDDELRRLATTLNEMLDRLEAAIERERQFADDASHELRTPLALHKAELEVALRYGGSEAELRAAIESGVQEVDRLARLAEDLLLVARSGESGLPLTSRHLEAEKLFERVVARFANRAAREGRSIHLNVAEGLELFADELRLEQAVTNMIDNALRHGGGDVTVQAAEHNGQIRILVTDQGEGWDTGFLPHAFERFSRGDAAREGEGTGLGLAIVDTIARAHGGAAGAGNTGEGGAVWIDLPRGAI